MTSPSTTRREGAGSVIFHAKSRQVRIYLKMKSKNSIKWKLRVIVNCSDKI